MRVAVFTETFLPNLDGITRVVTLLLDHLHAKGIETLVVSPNYNGEEPMTDYNGSKVVTVDGMPIPFYPERLMTLPSPTVYRELQAFQPDIAHFFHPVTVGLPGFAIAKAMKIPTLVSFHLDYARLARHFHYGPINLGFLSPMTEVLTKLVFNWAEYSLAPSKQIQRDMLAMGIQEVGLWKRGVDAVKFHPDFYSDEMRYQLSDGNVDDTLLLYVGRLSYEKKVHDLRPILDKVPNTRLAIVGDGPYRAELEEIFAGTNTKFMGYMKGEALSQAYASADIFTFPSSLETFGLVVVEAMAAGLPVVASRVGGIPDVVSEGQNGYTFDVGDTDALCEGVANISTSRERIQIMGRNARAFAETQTWDYMMDEVIDHYDRLIYQYKRDSSLSA